MWTYGNTPFPGHFTGFITESRDLDVVLNDLRNNLNELINIQRRFDEEREQTLRRLRESGRI